LSLSTVQWWLQRFKQGNTSYEEAEGPGRPMIVIGDILSKFLAKYPFASVKVMSQHFGVGALTVKETRVREFGFKKYARRRVPYLLDGAQEKYRLSSTISC
jgi:transposase